MTRVEVVSGVLVRDGRLLLTQRDPRRADFGLAWECPGGKVEDRDWRLPPKWKEATDPDRLAAHRRAVARELYEELGALVAVASVLDLLTRVDLDPPYVRAHLAVHFYRLAPDALDMRTLSQTPAAREGVGLGWFARDELRGLRLTPGNRAALPALLALLPYDPPAARVARPRGGMSQ